MSFVKEFLSVISEEPIFNTSLQPHNITPVEVTQLAAITNPVAVADPVEITLLPIISNPAAVAEPVAAVEPVAVAEPIVVAEPVAVAEPVVVAEPIAAAEPVVAEPVTAAVEPVVVTEPVVVAEPIADAEPVVAEPVTAAEPAAAVEPIVVTEPVVVAEPIADAEPVVAEPAPKPISIVSYFAEKGVQLTIPDIRTVIPPIESLAFSIAINFSHTKNFIRHLRDCICRKNYTFSYSVMASQPQERSAITSLATLLNEYCLISGYSKVNNVIRGTISSNPKCINFLCGDFAEMYAKSVTVGVLKKLSAEHGVDYEIYNNVKIEKNGEKHELDIVFRVGPHVFWEEVKSGELDADKYRKIGVLLNVIPDRLILLAAEKSNEAAQGISYFYDYFVANTNTFKNSLTTMIKKAFEEGTN